MAEMNRFLLCELFGLGHGVEIQLTTTAEDERDVADSALADAVVAAVSDPDLSFVTDCGHGSGNEISWNFQASSCCLAVGRRDDAGFSTVDEAICELRVVERAGEVLVLGLGHHPVRPAILLVN